MFLNTNQYIRMISKWSCDTEDWSNGCWKFSFTITEIYLILKYIQIENSYNNILQYSNKYSLGDQENSIKT